MLKKKMYISTGSTLESQSSIPQLDSIITLKSDQRIRKAKWRKDLIIKRGEERRGHKILVIIVSSENCVMGISHIPKGPPSTKHPSALLYYTNEFQKKKKKRKIN